MKLDDINNALDTSFDSDDYDSIGGLIIEHLDRLPEAEETIVTEDGITLQVMEISQNRIKKVKITLPEEIPESPSDTDTEKEKEKKNAGSFVVSAETNEDSGKSNAS